MRRSIPSLLTLLLTFSPSAWAGVEECREAYKKSYAEPFCSYNVSRKKWDKRCITLDAAGIKKWYCKKAYKPEYEEQYQTPMVKLTRSRWNRGCSGDLSPQDILAVICENAYDEKYLTVYEVPADEWNTQCWECRWPADILGFYRQLCREKYDPKRHGKVLTRRDWDWACKTGMDGLSSYDFFVKKRLEAVLDIPPDQVTYADAQFFLNNSNPGYSEDVRSKRAAFKKRVTRAQKALKKFGGKLRDMPLPPATGSVMKHYQDQLARFDGGAFKKSGSHIPGAGVFAVPWDFGREVDVRPLKPLQKGKGLDGGIDAPERVRRRLWDKVKVLALLRDEKGKLRYGPPTMNLMREILASVPIAQGDPPRTDLTALNDAKLLVETMEKLKPKVEWTRDMDAYASIGFEYDDHGKRLYWPNGIPRMVVRMRPGPKGSTERFAREKLAGTFMHEVGGHGTIDANGGGGSLYVHEVFAHFPQYRYYSNKLQEFTEKTASEQRKLDRERRGLSPKEIKTREKIIAGLIAKRDHFLNDSGMSSLEDFRGDPRKFHRDLISRYYGDGNEFTPGEMTLPQQTYAAHKFLGESYEDLATALKEKSWVATAVGWTTGAEEAARVSADWGERQLRMLKKDKEFEDRRILFDKDWRGAKIRECSDLLAADSRLGKLNEQISSLYTRLAKAKKAAQARLEKRVEAVEMKILKSEGKYVACSVNR